MNGDKIDSTVYINLDKPRRFKFSIGFMARLERLLGKERAQALNWSSLSMGELVEVLHVAFSKDDPDLTIEDIEDMIEGVEDYEEVVTKIVESMSAAFPEKKAPARKKKTTTKKAAE